MILRYLSPTRKTRQRGTRSRLEVRLRAERLLERLKGTYFPKNRSKPCVPSSCWNELELGKPARFWKAWPRVRREPD
jgi:hypothetical protein